MRDLKADALETLDFLWREYVEADPATLTEDAKELAERVRQKVRELAGVQRLEAERDALKARVAQVFGHKWRLSERTTPSGKALYECEACGLQDPAPVKIEFETRPCIPEVKALRAQLAEVEAKAAAMRETLEYLREQAGWTGDPDEECGLLIPSRDGRELRDRVAIALSTDAGRDMLERVRRLEAVAAEARAMHTTGEFVLTSAERFDKDDIIAIARGVLRVRDAVFPPSYKWRLDNLGAALRALEGGDRVGSQADR